jgi:hypothetical protein
MNEASSNHEFRREVYGLARTALDGRLSLYRLIEAIEKAVLEEAMNRHATHQEAYQALKIPRTSYFSKKRKYFTP